MTKTNKQNEESPTKSCRNLPKMKVSSRLGLYMGQSAHEVAKQKYNILSLAAFAAANCNLVRHFAQSPARSAAQTRHKSSVVSKTHTAGTRQGEISYFVGVHFGSRPPLFPQTPLFFQLAHSSPALSTLRSFSLYWSSSRCSTPQTALVQAARVGSGQARTCPTCPPCKTTVRSRRGAASG